VVRILQQFLAARASFKVVLEGCRYKIKVFAGRGADLLYIPTLMMSYITLYESLKKILNFLEAACGKATHMMRGLAVRLLGEIGCEPALKYATHLCDPSTLDCCRTEKDDTRKLGNFARRDPFLQSYDTDHAWPALLGLSGVKPSESKNPNAYTVTRLALLSAVPPALLKAVLPEVDFYWGKVKKVQLAASQPATYAN
jgi:hypothetical protein